MNATPASWTLTDHAVDRALDMALDPAEIHGAMHTPEAIREVTRREDCDWYYDFGRIALAVKDIGDTKLVRTVLWRTVEAWRADEQLPVPQGRTPRDEPLRRLQRA